MDIGMQSRPRSDAAERGVWSGSTLFALNSGIFVKHDDNKNKSDRQTLLLENDRSKQLLLKSLLGIIGIK